jgi:hypothetical protein
MGECEWASFLASCVAHAVALLSLALLAPRVPLPGPPMEGLVGSIAEPSPLALETALRAKEWSIRPPSPDRRIADQLLPDQVIDAPKIAPLPFGRVHSLDAPQVDMGRDPTRTAQWLLSTNTSGGGGLEGRGRNTRAALALGRGGSRASEDAVERGLKWLRAHQLDNGSWNFDHRKGSCQGLCRDPGSEASTTASTALALLAFLGAGYTHTEGEHQDAVNRGLYYLASRAVTTPHGADLQQGTMYAQGLSAIALCEAYAMTEDQALREVAQKATHFILYAQDKKGGGWRYLPGEPGDTTVTGWQLMALKSGQLAGLDVPSPSIGLVAKFLDSVQSDDGARYGYMSQEPRNSTTAIGLLCRMYLGWGKDRAALKRGVGYLDRWGPSKDDIYYDYYATQVMYHWRGPEWDRWNAKMRDYLVGAQASQGHESGSWHFDAAKCRSGGRLFSTAAAVMTLEVYYRYMPLYDREAVERGF